MKKKEQEKEEGKGAKRQLKRTTKLYKTEKLYKLQARSLHQDRRRERERARPFFTTNCSSSDPEKQSGVLLHPVQKA